MQGRLLIYHDLIEAIVTAMDARDPYTASHSQRVSDISLEICKKMDLSEVELEAIHIAAHVHDIGKIGIPDVVLSKSSALTDKEWNLMRDHAEIGFQILKKVKDFDEVAAIVRHHHERWDGKGYPLGLAAADIPLGSRIIALADSIDAMLSNREYRRAMSLSQCMNEIKKNSGKMYDPTVTEVVLQHWPIVIELYQHYYEAGIGA